MEQKKAQLNGFALTILNTNLAWTGINASWDYNTENSAKSSINKTSKGIASFADFWEIIVLAIVITIVIGFLIVVFGRESRR